MSERLDLLSFVAALWTGIAAVLGGLFALAYLSAKGQGETACQNANLGDCYTGSDVIFFIALIAIFLLLIVPGWLASWGIVTVALFGSKSSVHRLRPRIAGTDRLMLLFGSLFWTALAILLAFSSRRIVAYAVPTGLLVAVTIGWAWMLFGLLFKGVELASSYWHRFTS